MLEVPAPVSSFEVWLFEEGLVDQDLVWLCHSRGKGSLSMSPCFPKALLQSRSIEWSLAAPDVKGDPQGLVIPGQLLLHILWVSFSFPLEVTPQWQRALHFCLLQLSM